MLFPTPLVTTEEFAERSGWRLRPEGLCRDDVCVPVTSSLLHDGELDLARVAEALGMPLVRDDQGTACALGPAAGKPVLSADACAPDLVLPDVDGRPFALSSLRKRKVMLLAWASW